MKRLTLEEFHLTLKEFESKIIDAPTLNVGNQLNAYLQYVFDAVNKSEIVLEGNSNILHFMATYTFSHYYPTLILLKIYSSKFNEFITSSSVNINSRNNDGNTPVHLIIKSSNQLNTQQALKLSKEQGADFGIANNLGNTPLHLSVIRDNEAAFNFLMGQQQIAKFVKNSKGFTPLMLAVKYDNFDFAYRLVLKASTNYIKQALYIAISEGRTKFTELFLLAAVNSHSKLKSGLYTADKGKYEFFLSEEFVNGPYKIKCIMHEQGKSLEDILSVIYSQPENGFVDYLKQMVCCCYETPRDRAFRELEEKLTDKFSQSEINVQQNSDYLEIGW